MDSRSMPSAPNRVAPAERTNQHYDQDPRIFGLFLDRTLKYSSGFYVNETDSLEQAQLQKMELIAQQLGVSGGETVLDIGCGWGSLACFLAERFGCAVVGVTPCPQQAAYIRQRAGALSDSGRIRVEVTRIEEAELPASSFDAITLVGSIVHMADKQQVIAECRRLCRPRGRVYLSETCFRNWDKCREFAERPGTRFIRDTIFGWAELVPLSAMIQFFEQQSFSLSGLTDLTPHYIRTIEQWHRNLLLNQDTAETLQPGMVAEFGRYFETAIAALRYTVKQYAIVASKSR